MSECVGLQHKIIGLDFDRSPLANWEITFDMASLRT